MSNPWKERADRWEDEANAAKSAGEVYGAERMTYIVQNLREIEAMLLAASRRARVMQHVVDAELLAAKKDAA